MASYKMVQVFPEEKTNHVIIRTSDPGTITWIVSEVRNQLGSCETRNEGYDLANEIVACELHKLQGRDGATFHWVLRRLCEDGWEPYMSMAGSHWLRKASA